MQEGGEVTSPKQELVMGCLCLDQNIKSSNWDKAHKCQRNKGHYERSNLSLLKTENGKGESSSHKHK